MQHPSISLIIPCFNERVRIDKMWQGINNFMAEWQGAVQIIIVNDGSTDTTEEAIFNNSTYKQLLLSNKILYLYQANAGKGGALQNGIAHATNSYVLTLDADMATMPTELLQWLQMDATIFEGNNIVIASRTLAASTLVLISARRKTGNIFNKMVRGITGLPYRDTQCGFKLYPCVIAKELFANLSTKGWAHDVEILKKAKANNYPIIEMPITWNERDASKINVVKDGIKMLWDVLRMQ